jgi:hypothetical protein
VGWRKAAGAAAALWLVVLCGRQAWEASQRGPATPVDRALAPLVRAVPPSEREVEWVVEGEGTRDERGHRRRAQFALAPVFLVAPAPDARLVLAWSDDPAALEPLGTARGARLVARFEEGYALFERRPR